MSKHECAMVPYKGLSPLACVCDGSFAPAMHIETYVCEICPGIRNWHGWHLPCVPGTYRFYGCACCFKGSPRGHLTRLRPDQTYSEQLTFIASFGLLARAPTGDSCKWAHLVPEGTPIPAGLSRGGRAGEVHTAPPAESPTYSACKALEAAVQGIEQLVLLAIQTKCPRVQRKLLASHTHACTCL